MRTVWMLGFLLAGCTLFDSGRPPTPAGDLEANRRLWAAQQRTAYEVTYRVSCFCPAAFQGPFTVTVVDGRFQSIRPQPGGDDLALMAVYTVEGLFDLIEDAYDRKAHRVEVTYHPELGYPEHVFIDYEEQVVDEELGVDVIGIAWPEVG